MDFSKFDIPDTVSVHLEFSGNKLYDDKEKTKPCVISVYGPASSQAIEYGHTLLKKTMSKVGKRGLKSFKMSPDEIDQQNVERLCALTASVENITYKGEPVTTDNIERFYSDPKMGWVCNQLDERLGSWEDFLG